MQNKRCISCYVLLNKHKLQDFGGNTYSKNNHQAFGGNTYSKMTEFNYDLFKVSKMTEFSIHGECLILHVN